MRVAITGAGGLLGGCVLRHAIEAGHEVVAMSGSLKVVNGCELLHWNSNQDWERTAEVLHGVDAIVHSGAYIPINHNDPSEAAQCLSVNALGTLGLLRAAEHVGIKRFIYVSGSNVLNPRSSYVNEDDPVGCQYSPYYLGSKVMGEIYVRAAIERGLSGLIVRPSSIYGPGMTSGAIYTFGEHIKRCIPIRLQNAGRFRADYVWRDDVARVLTDALVTNRQGEVNLGSGSVISIFEMAQLMIDIFNADSKLIEVLDFDSSASNSGFSPVDIARARSWFNFYPLSLREGLVRMFGSGA